MKITDTYYFFYSGELSNWYPCKFVDLYTTKEFSNTEQAFMWYKAIHFNDHITADKILKTTNPAQVKALGREVDHYNESIWNKERYNYMIYVNNLKFSQNEDLKRLLQGTGNRILVEASPVDRIWGIGMAETDPQILDETKWRGTNLLGKALMEVRKNL